MPDCMTFPDDWHEFLDANKIVDSEHIYTNGAELISILRVKQLIEHLLAAQPKWISVKDRTPEQAGYRCLVSAEYGDGKRCVFTAFTGYGDFKWYTYDCVYMAKIKSPSDNTVHQNYTITHWMPLPQPPKE